MEITYEARYDEGSVPALCKVVRVGNESVATALSLSNSEEVSLLSDDLIWDHMRNLTLYLNTLAGTVTLVPQGMMPDSGWPISGWNEISKTHEDILQWWIYVTQRDEQVHVIHNLVS